MPDADVVNDAVKLGLINDGTASPGSLVEVEITEAHEYDVVGRLVRILVPGDITAVRLPVMG